VVESKLCQGELIKTTLFFFTLMTCIFCDIVAGRAPCHKVWEDDDHLAFLSIYPNTEGVTVVIPKQHYASDPYAVPDAVYHSVLAAAKKVAQLLTAAFDDVGRVALVLEGFGIDHLHVKLFPLHGTAGAWEQRRSSAEVSTYFEQYAGYVSSHDAERADDEELARLAARIRAFGSH